MSAAAGSERPQVVSHVQQALSYTVFDCKWVPRSARLLCLGSAARGTGLVQLYELHGGRLELLREVSAVPLGNGRQGAWPGPGGKNQELICVLNVPIR